ncbi:hypothetical protein N8J89_35335 [Crossiella sp. CA-258035]|uniref:hypothetical protein n=1 Tax=Crossiella sp. CA-258035 TaxID=2981138 RepID=UPI0024BC7D0D|nr:hypothetical protein [Crossiella sp. CA-258035]WHT18331.1 hypothetical protein N8J89_35335 [Crossiella sp. CA-258035]
MRDTDGMAVLLGANRTRGSALGMAIFLCLPTLLVWFVGVTVGPIEYPEGSWPARFITAQAVFLVSLLLAAGLLLLLLRQAIRADQVNLPLLGRLRTLYAWFAGATVVLSLSGVVIGLLALEHARAGMAGSAVTAQVSMSGVAVMCLPMPYLFAASLLRRVEQAERVRTEHGWLS